MEATGVHTPREFVALIDQLPVPAIVALDPDVSAAQMNLAMQRMLDVPSSKRVITFHTKPYRIESAGRPIPKEETPLYRAAKGYVVEGEEYEFHLATGRRLTMLAYAHPLREESGAIAGSICTYHDVSSMRAAEKKGAERLAVLSSLSARLSEALTIESVVDVLSESLIPRMTKHVVIPVFGEDGRPMVVHVRPNSDGARPAVEGFLDGRNGYLSVPMFSHGRAIGVLSICEEDDGDGARDEALLREIARLAGTAIQNAQLYHHHEEASRIFQQALLPASLPSLANVHFDAVYLPGDDRALIGGDWYDAFELPDGRIAVSIGDVTGRGLIAAALMGKVRQTISGLSYYESDPVKLLDVAEFALKRRYPDSIVTAIVGVFNPANGEFVYASAGHPPPFLRRADGTVLSLPCHGLPLGLRDVDDERSAVTFRILPGDTLLLYTDGLTEAEHDPIAGELQVRHTLAQMPSWRRDVAKYIQEELLPYGSRDDVAMLAATFPDGEARNPNALEIKFDSRDVRMAQDVRLFVVEFLRQYASAAADVDSAELVLGELLSNAVRHARGPIEIHISWKSAHPIFEMLDSGEAYDPSMSLPEDLWQEDGRGLFLVGLLTRSFHVTRLFGGVNETRAELDVARA